MTAPVAHGRVDVYGRVEVSGRVIAAPASVCVGSLPVARAHQQDAEDRASEHAP